MNAQETIDRIDTAIDALRRELMNRLHFNPDCSARQWQAAWDRCPDLRARETELYRQRGDAQVVRDTEQHRAHLAQERRDRAKKRAKQDLIAWREARRCAACGALNLAA